MNRATFSRWLAVGAFAAGGTILTTRTTAAQSIVAEITTTNPKCLYDANGYYYDAVAQAGMANPYVHYYSPYFCGGAADIAPAGYSSQGFGSTAEAFCDPLANWSGASFFVLANATSNPAGSPSGCTKNGTWGQSLSCSFAAPTVNGCPPNNTITVSAFTQ